MSHASSTRSRANGIDRRRLLPSPGQRPWGRSREISASFRHVATGLRMTYFAAKPSWSTQSEAVSPFRPLMGAPQSSRRVADVQTRIDMP